MISGKISKILVNRTLNRTKINQNQQCVSYTVYLLLCSEMSRLNKDLFSYSKIHPLKNGTFGSQFSNDWLFTHFSLTQNPTYNINLWNPSNCLDICIKSIIFRYILILKYTHSKNNGTFDQKSFGTNNFQMTDYSPTLVWHKIHLK